MKLSHRIAAMAATAGITVAAFAAPASAADFASLSSTNKELSTQYDWVACGVLEFGLKQAGVLEEGQHNRELAEAIAAKGENGLTQQFPQLDEWNEGQAAALADRAQTCGLVKADTYLSELSSNFSS
ncbi:porin [Corynebacterium glutamicum]|uniref:porin n=1 Tax=Corynebacterium glutamicum TaxID=1718 RepID=UPI00058A5762|nr:porin [Corynebacterium glutamicum]AJE66983.1 porin [Corynebacterium glutamicum]OKX95547.1 porin [Corynebacterium glutamicum]TWS36159.1 porin [Corynebacterium glutamicum]